MFGNILNSVFFFCGFHFENTDPNPDYHYSADSGELASGGVVGSMEDGVMSCSYTLSNTDLPTSDLQLIYAAMG